MALCILSRPQLPEFNRKNNAGIRVLERRNTLVILLDLDRFLSPESSCTPDLTAVAGSDDPTHLSLTRTRFIGPSIRRDLRWPAEIPSASDDTPRRVRPSRNIARIQSYGRSTAERAGTAAWKPAVLPRRDLHLPWNGATDARSPCDSRPSETPCDGGCVPALLDLPQQESGKT